ncbi:MAG: hypothetical protein ACJAZ8_002376 [Planctomycetota bacterium]|jgi:hypothetical protein
MRLYRPGNRLHISLNEELRIFDSKLLSANPDICPTRMEYAASPNHAPDPVSTNLLGADQSVERKGAGRRRMGLHTRRGPGVHRGPGLTHLDGRHLVPERGTLQVTLLNSRRARHGLGGGDPGRAPISNESDSEMSTRVTGRSTPVSGPGWLGPKANPRP